jgi:hypothetical protein
MAIYRPSDSLSRCDPNLYSSMFDVRKRSDIKQESIAATQPIHKDTIEISRDKLEEEALSRLRHTSECIIAQNSFIRIGKYLFLAIAFPPYFIIYGLPKWVLTEGIPAIFSIYMSVWRKVQHQTQKYIASRTQKIVYMVQFVQRLAQVLIQPIVHLTLEIRQSIRRMREHTLQFFKMTMGRAKSMLKLPLQFAEGFKRLQKRMTQIREKWSQQVRTLSTRMQEGIQWIKESPQIFLGWGHAQLQRLNQQAVSWRTQWKSHFQNSQQFAQRTTNWVYRQFKNGIEGLKSCFNPFVNVYRHQLQPQWQRLKEICKGKWQQTRDFFHQKHQKALAFLQAKQEKLKQLSSLRFIQYLMSHPWMGKLPLRLQNCLKKFFSHPTFRFICEGGIKAYSFVASSLLRSASLGLQILSKGTILTLQACDWLRASVKTTLKKVVYILKIGQGVFRKCALHALYYCLLFVMMALILLMWGGRFLGQCMGALTLRFPFKRFKT